MTHLLQTSDCAYLYFLSDGSGFLRVLVILARALMLSTNLDSARLQLLGRAEQNKPMLREKENSLSLAGSPDQHLAEKIRPKNGCDYELSHAEARFSQERSIGKSDTSWNSIWRKEIVTLFWLLLASSPLWYVSAFMLGVWPARICW